MNGTAIGAKSGAAALALAVCLASAADAQTGYFGHSKVNINPTTPVVLSGYAGRSGGPEATFVRQNIVAQAAVFGTGADTSILFTVDCTGVPDNVVDPLKEKLSQDLGVAQEKIVITCTHSHNCPHVDGYLPNLFSPPLTSAQQAHVVQYTQELAQKLEDAALDAIADRTPGHQISWGNGSVGFAANRRGSSQVDHDLPVMLVRDSLGAAKAIITSYATHAVTIGGGDANAISGDWPGYARERIEALFPGVAAMVMIGAGADSNPSPQGTSATAQAHGQTIANEVQRLISSNLLTPVSSNITAFHDELELDYATTLAPGDPGSARLAPSASSALYGVTSWTFGDDLAMVFMEGEVVVDYSLRLKQELGDKVWVTAYSNDVQGYIPSERILYEGGYEADESSFYYALPGRFKHGLEDKIIGAVNDQLFDFTGLGDRLQLVVDWSTGAVTMANLGSEVVTIDAYTITSPTGNLRPANGQWLSLQDQGLPGWDQADNSNASRLTEFNPTGVKVFNPGNSVSLGAPVTLAAPANFGDAIAGVDLRFEYHVPGEGTVAGIVRGQFSDAPINNLVLTIDPETGAAAVQNASPFFDVSITAYTITSGEGNLLTANAQWNSLQDQGIAGWDQADNSSAARITEFKTTGSTLLPGGETVLYLGAPIDVSGGEPLAENFTFEFLLSTGQVMKGAIVMGELPAFDNGGDFDDDGDVDGGDFLVWQRTLGVAVTPAGSGADANGNGLVDRGDLIVWHSRYGAASATAAGAAVPEPAAWMLGLGLAVGGCRCSQRRSRR